MTAPPDTSPPRPSLEQAPGKPDITVVLAEARQESAPPRWVLISPAQRDLAIATITGLRESDARRLQLINQAKGERDEARARVAELERVVERAGKQFRHYESLHMAKGSLDGDAKARTNCEFAEMCEAVLPAPLPDAPLTVEAGR